MEDKWEQDKLRTWAMRKPQGPSRELISSFLFTAQQKAPDTRHTWINPCYIDDKPMAILAGA